MYLHHLSLFYAFAVQKTGVTVFYLCLFHSPTDNPYMYSHYIFSGTAVPFCNNEYQTFLTLILLNC